MKLKSRKLTSFFTTLVVLVTIYILTVIFAPEALGNGLGSTIIFAILGNGATLIGGNAMDKFTVSKYYQKDLVGK